MPTFLRAARKQYAHEGGRDFLAAARAEAEAMAETRARALLEEENAEAEAEAEAAQEAAARSTGDEWEDLVRDVLPGHALLEVEATFFEAKTMGLEMSVVLDGAGTCLLVVDRVWPVSEAHGVVMPTDVLSRVAGERVPDLLERFGWALPRDYGALRRRIADLPRPLRIGFLGSSLGREGTALRHAAQHRGARRVLAAARRRARSRLRDRRGAADRAAEAACRERLEAGLKAHAIKTAKALPSAVAHERRNIEAMRALLADAEAASERRLRAQAEDLAERAAALAALRSEVAALATAPTRAERRRAAPRHQVHRAGFRPAGRSPGRRSPGPRSPKKERRPPPATPRAATPRDDDDDDLYPPGLELPP